MSDRNGRPGSLASGFSVGVAFSTGVAIWMLTLWARYAHREQVAAVAQVRHGVESVRQATDMVQGALLDMAAETARAQRLAVWVGVGTAVVGAILGGFAGAVAARLVGG